MILFNKALSQISWTNVFVDSFNVI